MATATDVRRLRAANADLANRAAADFRSLFASLDLSNPVVSRNELLVVVPLLTTTYGGLSAAVSAEWYDELRADTGQRGRFRAQPAPPVSEEAVRAQARWAAGGLWSDNPGGIVGVLANDVDKYVRQPGRDTIGRNAGRDRARWARVPSGVNTCAFCTMLAGRGFAYRSEHTASRDANGEDYHGGCNCEAVPDWSDNPILEGYDPDRYFDLYNEAAAVAGRNDPKAVLAEMRTNGRVTDAHTTAP